MKQIVLPPIIKCDKANDFMGIKIIDGKVTLYLPTFFRISEDETVLRRDIILFLKSINIAKSIEKKQIKMDNRNDIEDYWPVESYLWLLKDYLLNGVFYNREKVYVNDVKGKIDWKKTIRSTPIFSNGNIIYDKIISVKNVPSNDVISQIHRLCVYQSQLKVGWLFGLNVNIFEVQQKSIKEMQSIVSKELRDTFDDVKRIRFEHMLKVLKNIEGQNATSRNSTYGIDNYYYVYERMVDALFKGVSKDEMKKYTPKGYWNLMSEGNKDSSKLYPDTIYETEEALYIIDAKMYQYGYSKEIDDLPSTSSMQKQVTYGDYVKKRALNNRKVRNAFILPYDMTLKPFVRDEKIIKYRDNELAYIGSAHVNWRDSDNEEDYDTIYTYLLDFNYLLRNYLKNDELIDVLCTSIEKQIEAKNRKED